MLRSRKGGGEGMERMEMVVVKAGRLNIQNADSTTLSTQCKITIETDLFVHFNYPKN
jgi:hypothetical protein